MSWGDPFSSLYKEDDDRLAALTELGLTPGALVSFGDLSKPGGLTVWEKPYFNSECWLSSPGLAVIISVDCETDPVNDWIYLFINTQTGTKTFCWLPGNLVKVV